MRILLPVVLLAACVSTFQAPISAQPAPGGEIAAAQVEVSAVKFDVVRVGNDSWLESAVELTIKPGGRAVTGEFIDRVRVSLSLAFEATDAKGEKKPAYYRSSAEAISLEGGTAVFRFYLPPEIVRRDRLRADANQYVVEVEVGGKPLPLARGAFSRNFSSLDSVKSFQARVGSDGAANEGVLMPQYFTPFDREARRPSPTFFRREAHR